MRGAGRNAGAGWLAALALACLGAPALADAGASGRWPVLAEVLALREAGSLAEAEARLAASDLTGETEALREAQLARAELDLAAGRLAEARAGALALLPDAGPRAAAALAVVGAVQSAEGEAEAATGTFLRALRLARGAHAATLGQADPQALADLNATLAALAEHLLDQGDGEAAALLAAELMVQASDLPPGLPPRGLDGAAISALAHLRDGRPVEALVRAAPLFQPGAAPGTDRSRRLTDRLAAGIEAAARAEPQPKAALEGWIADSTRLQAEEAALDAAVMEGLGPMLAALEAGDAVAADAAGRQALAQVRADDPLVTTAYLSLLGATMRAGRPDLAEAWGLRIAEMPAAYVAGLDADPWPLLADLASDLRSRGAYPGAIAIGEAIALVAPLRAAAGEADRSVAALTALATTYTDAGLRPEAAALFDQALARIGAVAETGAKGLEAEAISALVGRATLRADMGAGAEAVADLDAALGLLRATDEGQRPAAWLYVGAAAQAVHAARGDAATALPALREVAARVDALAGPASAEAAEAWLALAQGLLAARRFGEAADPLDRAASAAQASLAPDDPLVLRIAVLQADGTGGADLLGRVTAGGDAAVVALAEAASAAAGAGDDAGAVAFLDQAIAALDEAAPTRAYFQAAKGEYLWRIGDAAAALPPLREATRALTRAERRGEPKARAHLPAHVAAALALADASEGVAAMNAFTEAFQVAQRVDDLSAGAALGRATARLLGSGPEADRLAREMQDAERQFDAARETYLAQLATGQGVAAPRQALALAQDRLDTARAAIRDSFPDYAALADPRPVDLLSTVALLAPHEVLVLFASAPGDDPEAPPGQVFAITADGYMAAPLPPREELARLAQGLRCAAALTDRRCGAGAGGTRGAFSLTPAPQGADFDYALAHEVWQALFAQVTPALQGKTALIVVPDRTLSSMPFHLALTGPPTPATTPTTAPWLLRQMAVTVAPSVAGLAALRSRDARPSGADLPFLGVGDPLIGAQAAGPVGYDCGDAAAPLLAASLAPPAAPLLRDAGAAVDRAALSALPALPDTRCELMRNAEALGPGSRVLLQAEATEAALGAMSLSGDLGRFRILSFATHGLIAGEVGADMVGLVLTPPAGPAPAAEDGLLTTAEIATLRLDADLVILSACNTASGSSRNSEGLAGLASGFFLAGARGLLVSHWPVYSDAATDLATGMVAAMAAPDRPGQAEALRRAALAILDDPQADARQRHPAYWAPFMVVGKGG